MIRWCCRTFEWANKGAGEQGFRIVVLEADDGSPRFVLQHRAVERANEGRLNTPFPVALVTNHDFRYCPWCGSRLARVYKRTWKALLTPDLAS